jgi:hypothetical protein
MRLFLFGSLSHLNFDFPRNLVWQMLLDEGVDWLNVDDLPAARDF